MGNLKNFYSNQEVSNITVYSIFLSFLFQNQKFFFQNLTQVQPSKIEEFESEKKMFNIICKNLVGLIVLLG